MRDLGSRKQGGLRRAPRRASGEALRSRKDKGRLSTASDGERSHAAARGRECSGSRAKWSYVLLAEELRRVCAEPRKAAAELFRRMCFNALISNTDDHPRNHAILAKDRAWKTSPAYDITPSRHVSLEHRDLAMTVGDLGRYASAQNLLSQCNRFLLDRSEAKAIRCANGGASGWQLAQRCPQERRHRQGIVKRSREHSVYPGFSFRAAGRLIESPRAGSPSSYSRALRSWT